MEKTLNEELLKQLSLINYNRSKTLFENHVVLINEQNQWSKITLTEKKDRKQYCYVTENGKRTPIGVVEDGNFQPTEFGKKMKIFTSSDFLRLFDATHPNGTPMCVQCDEYGKEQIQWPKTEEGKGVINLLIDLGHDRFILQGATSANNAYNLAAVSAIRKLTEKLVGINGVDESFFRATVLNKKPAGGVQKFSAFDDNLIEKLNKDLKYADIPSITGKGTGSDRTVGSTFALEDFYFNYGVIFNTVKELNIYNNYLFPDGVYNFFTQFFGGDNVTTLMRNIETQNLTNRPKVTRGDGWTQVSYTDRATNETEWAPIVEALHIILPAASFVLNVFGGPPGMVVGAGLEVIDAGLYEFYDEDHYMAGLSLVFAFVPLGELKAVPGFKQMTEKVIAKEALETILWKQVRKQALNQEEELFVKSVLKDKKMVQETYEAIINTSLRKLASRSPESYLSTMYALHMRGIIGYSKYATIVHLVLGTAVYDYWAYHYLGKCSASFKFSDLVKLIPETRQKDSVNNLIRMIEIQPFTSTEEACEAVIQVRLAKEREKLLKELTKNYQKLVIAVLRGLISNKLVLSVELSNTFEIEVAMIQTILSQCGFPTFVPNEKKVEKNIQTGTKYTKEQCMRLSMSMDVYKLSQHPECNQYINPDKKVSKGTETLLKSKTLTTYNTYYYGKTMPTKFNWGFYDIKTKKAVEEFQNYHNLNGDGVVGPATLAKLFNVVSGQKCGLLLNHSGMDLTQVNEDLLNAEIIKRYFDSLVLDPAPPPIFDPGNLTPEDLKKIDDATRKYLIFDSQKEIDSTMKEIEKKF
jgi:hypothetical protein